MNSSLEHALLKEKIIWKEKMIKGVKKKKEIANRFILLLLHLLYAE